VEETVCPWTAGGAAVAVAKGAAVPVTAQPLMPDRPLPPCGALFPDDADAQGRLRLRWERGFAAHLLLGLVEKGVDIDGFNARRFCREIEERFEDPWELDAALILGRILEGCFRVTDLKGLPEREVLVPVGGGSWFTESPFSAVREADQDGSVAVSLSRGCHWLFRLGDGWSWRIAVGEPDIVMLECGPPRRGSGE
jgi:hypothetical protein